MRRFISQPKTYLWILLLLMACVAAACGGGTQQQQEQGGTQGGQSGGQNQQARVIEIDSGEFYFEPDEIRVRQGEPVEFVVINSGAVEHNISIDEFNIDRDYDVGETIRVSFTPNRKGEFRIYCDIPGHTPAGMVGTLIVE